MSDTIIIQPEARTAELAVSLSGVVMPCSEDVVIVGCAKSSAGVCAEPGITVTCDVSADQEGGAYVWRVKGAALHKVFFTVCGLILRAVRRKMNAFTMYLKRIFCPPSSLLMRASVQIRC